MKIACDWDGTIAQTEAVCVDLINFRFGTSYKLENVTSWEFWENLGPEYNKAFWDAYALMDERYYRRAIPPTHPMACATIKELSRRHDVEIVSSNSPKSELSIRAWNFGHGLDLPIKCLGRGTDKSTLPYDIFIDDNPHLAERIFVDYFPEDGHNKRMILIDQPWNHNIRVGHPIYRLTDWTKAFDLFKELGL